MSHSASAAPPIEVATLTACPNCGESFGERGERRRRFCPECGQETTVRAPTLGEFAQQFGGAYLAIEHRLQPDVVDGDLDARLGSGGPLDSWAAQVSGSSSSATP